MTTDKIIETLHRYADPQNWGYYDQSGAEKGHGQYTDACFVGPEPAQEALEGFGDDIPSDEHAPRYVSLTTYKRLCADKQGLPLSGHALAYRIRQQKVVVEELPDPAGELRRYIDINKYPPVRYDRQGKPHPANTPAELPVRKSGNWHNEST